MNTMGNDLSHPFNDAANPAAQLPNVTLVRACSPLELRLRPKRLTDVIAHFLDDAWATPDEADVKPRPEESSEGGVELCCMSD